jgi:hypothetical protein
MVTSRRIGNGTATCCNYGGNGFACPLKFLPKARCILIFCFDLLIRGAIWLRPGAFRYAPKCEARAVGRFGETEEVGREARAKQTVAAISSLSMLGSSIEPRIFLAPQSRVGKQLNNSSTRNTSTRKLAEAPSSICGVLEPAG